MRITAELSLYPLDSTDPVAKILAFIGEIRSDTKVEVVVNQMSTQIRGEHRDVLALLGRAMERSFEAGSQNALVVKFLSSDLPISEPPDLSARD
jgi:uncharacterized protein YqgV (UPF0045/DUF77 family)